MKKNIQIRLTLVLAISIFLCNIQAKGQANPKTMPSCNEMKDMIDALPNLTSYGKYKLTGTSCGGAGRRLVYRFTYDLDKLEYFQVTFKDIRKMGPEKNLATVALKKDYNSIKQQAPNKGAAISTLGFGDYAYVTVTAPGFMEQVSQANIKIKGYSAFYCIVNGNYTFDFLVFNDRNTCLSTDDMENFIKDYIRKIDISKLL